MAEVCVWEGGMTEKGDDGGGGGGGVEMGDDDRMGGGGMTQNGNDDREWRGVVGGGGGGWQRIEMVTENEGEWGGWGEDDREGSFSQWSGYLYYHE